MKIQRNDADALNTTLSIEIEKGDYFPKYEEELKKYRSKAQLKGFRKGKTPLGFIKKMYGKSILAEAVNGSLQKGLFDYIKDNDLNVLGDPLPSEKQDVFDFDTANLSSYTFQFDLGMSPALEVKGASKEDTYDLYDITIGDKVIDEEIETAQKRQGKQDEITEDIELKDMLRIKALEIENGMLKEGGWETDFTLMVDLIGDEKVKKKVLTLKAGETFDFDIYNVEKDKDETHVRKYLLNLDDNEEKEIGRDFRGTIEKVLRLKPAALDQAFFDGYFGPDKVKSEEEARAAVKEEIDKYYVSQAKAFMYREMMDKLIEANQMELPEAFLKRWLKATNENLDDQKLEEQFPDFLKNLQWTLIRGELAKTHKVEVPPEAVKESIVKQVQQYFGQYGMGADYIDQTVNRMLQDRNHVNKVYEELLSEKVFAVVGDEVKTKAKKIDLEDFKAKVKEMNDRVNA